MALDDWKLQAIEESNAINQSPEFNWKSALGLGNNNQGIASASRNVPQNMQPYFSGDAEIFQPDENLVSQVPSFTPYTDYSNYEDRIQNLENMPNALQNLESQGTKKGFDFSKLANLLPGGILRGIMSNFRDSPQEKFNREYFAGEGQPGVYDGRIGGLGGGAHNVFGGKNVSYAFGPGLEVGAQKRIDTINKTLAKWQAKADEGDENAIQRLKTTALFKRRKDFTDQLAAYNKNLQIQTGRDPQPSGAGTTGGAVTTRVPQHHGDVSRSRGDHQAPAFRTAPKSWDVSSGMGPGGRHYAYGGRAGYQGGELVGQETDFIEGPQGGEEFQETVVEGQEQPSREQLEALAMEIFQLPLEELDEQQLLVVYQAAMQGQPMEEDFQENIQFADQGQPMEEDIQEEDIQFAANGGLASLL